MSFTWACHEFQLGPNYVLSVARPTDPVAEAKRKGEDRARSRQANARSLLVHKEL
jgi:hypothetical protein